MILKIVIFSVLQIRLLVYGSEETIDDAILEEVREQKEKEAPRKSDLAVALTLTFCFVGLQVTEIKVLLTKTY